MGELIIFFLCVGMVGGYESFPMLWDVVMEFATIVLFPTKILERSND